MFPPPRRRPPKRQQVFLILRSRRSRRSRRLRPAIQISSLKNRRSRAAFGIGTKNGDHYVSERSQIRRRCPRSHVARRRDSQQRGEGHARSQGPQRRARQVIRRVVENQIGRDTSELQSPDHLVCRLLLEKKKISLAANISPM